MKRYTRQMILPEVGTKGQDHLAQSHVLVVGAGGLGCPVLQYLTGAGVGTITLIDPDVIEENNLHRQPLYSMDDIGKSKVEAAASRLTACNPEIELHSFISTVNSANVADLVRRVDLVIDAADTFAASYTLSDECRRQRKPLISASALGLTGYVGGFCGGAPSLRAVFPNPPDNSASCATTGVMGPVVGTLGTLQAQMALAVLLKQFPSPLGQLTTVNLRDFKFGGFSFLSAKEPDWYAPFIALSEIRPEDAVIELRGTKEVLTPAVRTAQRISPEQLKKYEFHSKQRIILCCKTGLRSWKATKELNERGYKNIALFADG
ncbi:HesA/MoeB/ThiF family protein [Pseudovibrio sp. Tun.PSC04-5.I4]|uniref:HesA/MoeB/ThiF family protein n=1 Tax=Pseudovibrio sp. Tun.PSC04-5.I4 TaxID=1798213 RepID=UPI000886A0DB|nr:HesA/MoeB/ThiF family protein [Pseudovibrio sp. Tun.PSC04-5.I4]SDQ31695.1 Molybdopterin or thiamine biosynthesis adenylyltransferase [Pseudovibrio sp. Tun.PSC04-5.I4]